MPYFFLIFPSEFFFSLKCSEFAIERHRLAALPASLIEGRARACRSSSSCLIPLSPHILDILNGFPSALALGVICLPQTGNIFLCQLGNCQTFFCQKKNNNHFFYTADASFAATLDTKGIPLVFFFLTLDILPTKLSSSFFFFCARVVVATATLGLLHPQFSG